MEMVCYGDMPHEKTVECPDCEGEDSEYLKWILCGGESGHGARPMHPDGPRKLRDDCKAAGVPFFFKQWGEWIPMSQQTRSKKYPDIVANNAHGCPDRGWPDNRVHQWKGIEQSYRCGRKAAGHLLDGEEWHQMPEGMRI